MMVENSKKIKIIGIIIAVVLVIGLFISLLVAWGPNWFKRDEQVSAEAQASLLVYKNGKTVAEPVEDLSDFIDDADKPIFIDFWAEWCAPCKLAAPFIESLAEEYDGKAYIIKVNIDDEPGIATYYSIQSIPTFMVIDDGIIQSSKMGYAEQLQPELKSMIDMRLQK